MSLSTLQAQLAALNSQGGSGTVPGSTLASSRRHDDAVGRGYAHSVQHGHAQNRSSSSTRFKPSLIQASAREAADIPESVLLEQAQDVLKAWRRLDPTGEESADAMGDDDEQPRDVLLDVCLVLEPLLTPSNTTTTTTGQQRQPPRQFSFQRNKKLSFVLLTLLPPLLAEYTSDVLTLLEFLVRRYDIHQSSLGIDLLWLVWPQAQVHPQLFHRVLQLIDVTGGAGQSYLWLRPYVVTKTQLSAVATTTTAATALPPLPPPTLLAQKLVQNMDLLKQVLRLLRSSWEHASTIHASSMDTSRRNSRRYRGAQHVQSWCTLLLLHGLQWMTTQPHVAPTTTGNTASSKRAGLNRERVLRTLLPCWLEALRHKSSREARQWGSVMTSAAVTTCFGELDPSVVNVLCSTLLQQSQRPILHHGKDESSRRHRRHVLESKRQALMGVVSMVLSLSKHSGNKLVVSSATSTSSSLTNERNHQYYHDHPLVCSPHYTFLPLLDGRRLGCILPEKTLLGLVQFDGLAESLGYLHTHQRMVVAPLVAALVSYCLSAFRPNSHTITADKQKQSTREETGSKEKQTNKRQQQQTQMKNLQKEELQQRLDLLESLVREPELVTFWKDERFDLIASLAFWTLSWATSRAKKTTKRRGKNNRGRAKTKKDAKATHAKPKKNAKKSTMTRGIINMKRTLLKALYALDDIACERGMAQAMESKTRKTNTKSNLKLLRQILPNAVQIDKSRALPPRLALEHSDAAVRYQAVKQITSDLTRDRERDSEEDDEERRESLAECLVKRWSEDEATKVARAASKALVDKGILRHLKIFSENRIRVGNLVLNGLYRWIDADSGNYRSKTLKAIEHGFLIASYVARALTDYKDKRSRILLHLLMEAMISFVDFKVASIAKGASSGLLTLLSDVPFGKRLIDEKPMVKKWLLENQKFVEHVRQYQKKTVGPRPETEMALRRRCTWLIIGYQTEALDDDVLGPSKASASDIFSLILSTLNAMGGPDIQGKSVEVIARCIVRCARAVAEEGANVLPFLERVASIPTTQVFASPLLTAGEVLCKAIVDEQGRSVSPLTVLMELASRPSCSALCVERLVQIAVQLIDSKDRGAPWMAVLPALALLEHSDLRVRQAAANLLLSIGKQLKSQTGWYGVASLCSEITKSLAAESGALSTFLSRCVKWNHDSSIAERLLKLLPYPFATYGRDEYVETLGEIFAGSWLTLDKATGGATVVTVILNGMESAGEDSFPLLARWELGAQPLLEHIVSSNITPPFSSLAEAGIKLLKGIQIIDPEPQVTISYANAPGGGRARSYSLSASQGIAVINPYPKGMVDMVVNLLTGDRNKAKELLSSLLVSGVLTSRSWISGVYRKLSEIDRRRFTGALLSFVDMSTTNLAALPFDASDLHVLLRRCDSQETSIPVITLATDAIRLHAAEIIKSPAVSDVFEALSNLLVEVSKSEAIQGSGTSNAEYLSQRILFAQLDLLRETEATEKGLELKRETISKLLGVIAKLLGSPDEQSFNSVRLQLKTHRSKAAASSVIVALCPYSPDVASRYLLTVVKSATSSSSSNEMTARAMFGIFSQVLPSFRKYGASAGLGLSDLFYSFISASRPASTELKLRLFRDLCKSLHVHRPAQTERESTIAGLISSSLALQVHWSGDVPADAIKFHVDLIEATPPLIQMVNLLPLFRYARFLVFLLLDDAQARKNSGERDLPTGFDIASLAVLGRLNKVGTFFSRLDSSHAKPVITLASALFKCCANALLLGSIQSFITKGKGDASDLCLRIWQETLHSSVSISGRVEPNEKKEIADFLSFVLDSLELSRLRLQKVLPTNVFVSSVSSIIKDAESEALRSKALQDAASRIAALERDSPELKTFVDLIPKIADMLAPTQEVERRPVDSLTQQSALLVIEQVSRALKRCRAEEDVGTAQNLLRTLKYCGTVLASTDTNRALSQTPNSRIKLVCSAALCSASVIQTVRARCLTFLPKILTSLAAWLTSANSSLATLPDGDKHASSPLTLEARLVQLSVVRALGIIIKAVPQFVAPYLHLLLTEHTMLSSSLRVIPLDSNVPLQDALVSLDNSLSGGLSPRLLLPAVSRAMDTCTEVHALACMLKVLEKSVEKASPEEAGSQMHAVLHAVEKACAFDGHIGDRIVLVKASNDALLGLVMKLSEIQLRRLYVSLRDWRGELDTETLSRTATIRFAFWSLSSTLSSKLQAIFLPCFGLVFEDAVLELTLAASYLKKPSTSHKNPHDTKRRRLETADYDSESLRCLSPLLLCLELLFKADSRDGGHWVKSSEGKRFHAILEPLAKLLQGAFPREFEHLVYRSGDGGGTVVKCLTALASAAGNEQLWKPLNHAVLEACGNELRSEVRKSGVVCLLSLFQTLGEEYMVLLPECLPVISELLEETDEETAALAKQCVSTAEELIGESLEESLR